MIVQNVSMEVICHDLAERKNNEHIGSYLPRKGEGRSDIEDRFLVHQELSVGELYETLDPRRNELIHETVHRDLEFLFSRNAFSRSNFQIAR